jgi:hypothetical protein
VVAGTHMGNTLGIHMGYTSRSFERFRMQRVGIRFVEASVASRSEADTDTLGANVRRGTFSEPALVVGRSHALCVRVPELTDQQASKTNGISSFVRQPQADLISDECFADKALSPAPLDLPPTGSNISRGSSATASTDKDYKPLPAFFVPILGAVEPDCKLQPIGRCVVAGLAGVWKAVGSSWP